VTAGGDDEDSEERRRTLFILRVGIHEDEAVIPTAIIATLGMWTFFRACAFGGVRRSARA
jgi:hypothetical protein